MDEVQVEITEVPAGTPEYEAALAWHNANGSRLSSPVHKGSHRVR
jgi:hypothetical protein